MRTRTITTLDDFVGVPEEELHNCLAAFARAIREAKAARTLLARGGDDAPSLVTFVWKPRPPSDIPSGGRAEPETPIAELDFNYETRAALLEARILCLEDFSELSRSDFWKMPGVGRGTIARVQDWLLQIALDFKAEQDPRRAAVERAGALRRLPAESRHSVNDDANIAELGLRTRTLTRVLKRGLANIGALRDMTLRDYVVHFGTSEAREIIDALDSAGLPLRCTPTLLDLWRAGLRGKNELPVPSDAGTPIDELQPWIGVAALRLKENGFRTLGAVSKQLKEGKSIRFRGIGPHTEREVVDFFRGLSQDVDNITFPFGPGADAKKGRGRANS
jgi:hypothetical protein